MITKALNILWFGSQQGQYVFSGQTDPYHLADQPRLLATDNGACSSAVNQTGHYDQPLPTYTKS